MARKIRAPALENRTSRLKLAPRRKPYFVTISPNIALGFRRNAGAGSWSVRASDGNGSNWLKSFGIADDFEEADGANVLTFWQAQDKARTIARGGEGANGDRPATISEALDAYESALVARGAGRGNVTRIRYNVSAPLAARPVGLVTEKVLRAWRDGLVTGGMKAASADRTARVLKAALALAAKGDKRIVNTAAWRDLERLPDAEQARQNAILPDDAVKAVVVSAYDIEPAFGLLLEVLAVTGARASQILRITVGDLEDDGAAPRLQVPSSRKGRRRKVVRKPLPIPVRLAGALRTVAAGRPDSDLLLTRDDGKPWPRQIDLLFRKAAMAIGLKRSVTPYSLRHSSIVRALLAGTPLQLVASSHDTSAQMIASNYAKYIVHNSDAVLRRCMLDLGEPAPADNVVAIRQK